jgi:hypothetical protein
MIKTLFHHQAIKLINLYHQKTKIKIILKLTNYKKKNSKKDYKIGVHMIKV